MSESGLYCRVELIRVDGWGERTEKDEILAVLGDGWMSHPTCVHSISGRDVPMIMSLQDRKVQLMINIMDERVGQRFASLLNEIENSQIFGIFDHCTQLAPQCIGSRTI